jgi:hypothetical protein
MTAKELLELRAQRKTLKNAIDTLVDKAVAEKRELTDAEDVEVRKAKTAEAADMDKRIDGALDAIESEKRNADEREPDRGRGPPRGAAGPARAQQQPPQAPHHLETPTATRRDPRPRRLPDDRPRLAAFTAVYGDEKRGRQEAYKDGMWIIGNLLGNEEARQWSRDYGYGRRDPRPEQRRPHRRRRARARRADQRDHLERRAARHLRPVREHVPMGMNDTCSSPSPRAK